NPPELTNYNVSPSPADYGDRVYFYSNFSDSDGYIIDYSWISDSDGLLSSSGNFSTNNLSAGYHNISLRAKDDDGAWSDSENVVLNIIEPEIPDDPIEVRIGLLNPSTGPIAVYAEAFTDAAKLAIAHLNEGQNDYYFILVEADSGCDGTSAATGAMTLIDAGVVGIAGAACSGATLGAIEVAKTAGVPMVSYASTSPAITNYDDEGYLFRVVPSDAQQGAALADAYEASGYTNPAVIAMTNDYGAGFHAAFLDNWDGDVCVESTYDDDTTDFTAQVAAV
ncbi:uncharacterized protein METZ01_LOCUS407953, partial [marine metagenome]